MKVALVLGGGSARGLAHLGVLQVLERKAIPIDLVVGTSMGAVIGGAYCLHPDIETLIDDAKEFVQTQEMRRISNGLFGLSGNEYSNPFLRFTAFVKERYTRSLFALKQSLVSGQVLEDALRWVFDDYRFSDTKTPFACVATDLITGEDEIFTEGSLLDAVRASVAIPGVFPPVKLYGDLLVDGGVTSIVPIDAALSLGADLIIVSDVTTPLGDPQSVRTGIDINYRMYEIVRHRLNALQIEKAHIRIHPETHRIHWANFNRIDDLIQLGKEAAEATFPSISEALEEGKRRGILKALATWWRSLRGAR
jgi:NTE family protein